jgi:hypothetical protein
MKKKLIDLINNGWDVKFWNQVKRMDGDFVIRVCWEARYGEERYECEWKGYKTARACINNFINTAIGITEKLKKNEKNTVA